jgi:hypothetical protein
MSSMETARDAAAKYIEPLPLDLKGRIVRLATFATEEDCRHYYPRRALQFQQQLNIAISREVRKRKGKVERIFFAPADCTADLGNDNTPESRRTWLEPRLGLMP